MSRCSSSVPLHTDYTNKHYYHTYLFTNYMEKIKFLSALTLIGAAAFGLTACSSSDDVTGGAVTRVVMPSTSPSI